MFAVIGSGPTQIRLCRPHHGLSASAIKPNCSISWHPYCLQMAIAKRMAYWEVGVLFGKNHYCEYSSVDSFRDILRQRNSRIRERRCMCLRSEPTYCGFPYGQAGTVAFLVCLFCARAIAWLADEAVFQMLNAHPQVMPSRLFSLQLPELLDSIRSRLPPPHDNRKKTVSRRSPTGIHPTEKFSAQTLQTSDQVAQWLHEHAERNLSLRS
jgi:hypothetical protein